MARHVRATRTQWPLAMRADWNGARDSSRSSSRPASAAWSSAHAGGGPRDSAAGSSAHAGGGPRGSGNGDSAHPGGGAPAPGSASRQAPTFSIDDLKGRTHTLAAYKGKTLHLVFFAVWCPPCVEQLKRIEIADARLRGRGYRVLIVGLKDREDGETLRAFAERRQIGFPFVWDRDGSMAADFAVEGVPSHVIVSPTGAILYVGRDIPQGFERDGGGLVAP